MALGSYESEVGRGSVLNALAHPSVVNPVAAIMQGVNAAKGITDLRTSQFNLQQAQQGLGYQAMRMLGATNSNPTDSDVTAALGDAARMGGGGAIDPMVQNYTAWRARGGTAADFVRAYSAGGMSPEAQATAFAQRPVSADTGSNILFGTQGGILSADPGRFQLGTSIARGLSPGEATATRTVIDPQTGQRRDVPVGAAYGTPYGGGASGPVAGGPPGTSASTAVNNFGNIRAPGGGFASYDTPQAGVAAMASNLGAYQDQHGINTLNGITARWAPAGDGSNNPVAYAQTLSRLTGIDPNAQLNLHDPATLAKIIPAIAQVEHGRPMAVGGDVLAQGINAGISGSPSGNVTGSGGSQQGPVIAATSAQAVPPGSVTAPPGANVRPAAAPQYLDATGRPVGQGGGGGLQIPGMTQTPQGPVFTSPPPAAADNLQADITARNQASMGAADQQRTLQAGESALEALRLAKGYTGPGTDFSARAYAFLQAHDPTGALPQGNMSDTAWRQILAKNLLRFAQNSGLRGNTDLGLTEQLKGSANVDEMLPTANEHVLIQDISLARQRMAQTMLMPQPSIQGDVVNHFKSYTGNTDYRGFGWDLMSQPQRDAIEAEAKKSGPAAVARLTKAIHDGIAAGVTKPPQAPSGAAP